MEEHGQIAERSLAQETRCSFKEKRRGMLVLDTFKGLLTEKVKTVASDLLNMDLLIMPGGMTSQLQGLDVVINKPFLRRLYGEWLLSGKYPQAPAGNKTI
jgi:CBS-domain-containing membrane protein